MTRLGFATLVRENLKVDSSVLSDTVLLIYANLALLDIARAINTINEGFYGSSSFADLIAGQREYTLPADMLETFTGIEVKFKNDAAFKYQWLDKEIDLEREKKPTDEESIAAGYGYTTEDAAFFIYRNSIWLLSGTLTDTVVNGLKLWSFSEPDALPDLTNDLVDMSADPSAAGHGLPKAFHEILAYDVQIRWKNAQQQPLSLSEAELLREQKMQIALDRIKKRNIGNAVIAKVPLIEGGRPMGAVHNLNNGYF